MVRLEISFAQAAAAVDRLCQRERARLGPEVAHAALADLVAAEAGMHLLRGLAPHQDAVLKLKDSLESVPPSLWPGGAPQR